MKNKNVDKISTNYLYILYTKYKAEAVKLKAVDQLKAAEARERKKKYWNEERDYLAPLPNNALVVNPNLKQNPYWDSPLNQ